MKCQEARYSDSDLSVSTERRSKSRATQGEITNPINWIGFGFDEEQPLEIPCDPDSPRIHKYL